MEKNSSIRRKQAELDREQERERLHESYEEGKSNIDYQKLELNDIWTVGIHENPPKEEIEKLIGKPLPLITEEEWLEKELAKFDAKQPQYPQGKYQDINEIYVKIQQAFFQALRDSSPHIFEDLKILLTQFRILFGTDAGKYYEIIRKLKAELVCITIDFPAYSPSPPNMDYIWGETKLLFAAIQFALGLDLSAKHTERQIPENLSEAYQSAVNKELFLEMLKNKIDEFAILVIDAFKDSATDKTAILSGFAGLQCQLIEWAERYHLSKDWLIE